MNIVFIVVDTLRYDYIGANGNDWIRTPNLDKLTSASWAFDRCFSASYPTIPHRLDVMTGRYGSPFNSWKPLRFDVPTLPQALTGAGYVTQLIHDTPHLVNGGHNFDFPFHCWTFIRGAEVDRAWCNDSPLPSEQWPRDPVFDFMDDMPMYPLYTPYFWTNGKRRSEGDWNASQLFTAASEWLRDNASRENFFLWVDCFDPHEPWDAPPEYVKMYDRSPGYDGRIDPRAFWVYRSGKSIPTEAADRLRCLYAAKVTWMDRWLGVLLDTLEETGLGKNTAVVLTADHGTNVGERGRFGKAYPVREQEGHVPLIIRTPERDAGRSAAIVQPQDIHATLLGLAGGDVPETAQDVLKAAREGTGGAREIALSGSAAGAHWKGMKGGLFTVFSPEGYLEFGSKAEDSRFTPYGSLEDAAKENPGGVEELRGRAEAEMKRRGTDPSLLAWLKSEGRAPFPDDCVFWEGWPGPPGYEIYFRQFNE